MYVLMSLGEEENGGDSDDYVVAVSESVERLQEHAEDNFKFSGKYVWGEESNGVVYGHYDLPGSYMHKQDAFHITQVDVI